jgi:hypothetical protein
LDYHGTKLKISSQLLKRGGTETNARCQP